MAVTHYPKQSRLATWLEGKRSSRILDVALVLLLIAALLLPPVSLISRVTDLGTAQVTEAGGTISDPDGTQVIFAPGHRSPNRSAPASLRSPGSHSSKAAPARISWTAAKAIPPNLVAKSPFYQLKLRGEAPTQSTWVVPIPNDSEPYETLDVYTWESAAQAGSGSRTTSSARTTRSRARVNAVPALGDGHADQPEARARVGGPGAGQAACRTDGSGALAEVHPTGLYLGGNGTIDGAVDATFDQLGGAFAVIAGHPQL